VISSEQAHGFVQRHARIRVHSGALGQDMVMAEGHVISYCAAPTLTIEHDDGSRSTWSADLPIREVVPSPVTAESEFAAAVRQARTVRGWSQERLATEFARAGVNVGGQSGVARIERGERPTRLDEVAAIARLLGIELHIGGDPR